MKNRYDPALRRAKYIAKECRDVTRDAEANARAILRAIERA